MKKKILALCLVVVLAVTAVTGVTLAYFTDTDEETNVFTMGGITIDLEEKQIVITEDEDGKEKEEVKDFEDNKELMPGVENKEDKIVYIENTCENDAFVWYEWWIPAALDSKDGSTGRNNVLHVNSYGATWDNYVGGNYTYPAHFQGGNFLAPSKTNDKDGNVVITNAWDHDPETELKLPVGPEGYIRQETKDNVLYNVYLVVFRDVVPAGKITPPAMNGVYLDADLDMDVTEDEEGKEVITYTCHGKTVDFDFENNIKIPVYAFGIQAEIADQNGDGVVNGYDGYLAYNAE